jgi:NAD/NADP transhydrogenase alpha subunit
VLAIFVGYYVVWSVTPALHTPLMRSPTPSSVIVVAPPAAAAHGTENVLTPSVMLEGRQSRRLRQRQHSAASWS